jgi:hypothetical protein
MKNRRVIKVNSNDGVVGLGVFGLFFDAEHPNLLHADALCIVNVLQEGFYASGESNSSRALA